MRSTNAIITIVDKWSEMLDQLNAKKYQVDFLASSKACPKPEPDPGEPPPPP